MSVSLERYRSGEHLDKNPLWHSQDSPWKAQQILRMMARHNLAPKTICEVGCGFGEVLHQLQNNMDAGCHFWGYEISPQAFGICQSKANERLHFQLVQDVTKDVKSTYDLMLILDVIDHLEDYFSFLRALKPKAVHKILHIPLDLSAQMLLKPNGLLKMRDETGDLHYFTKEIALRAIEESGYTVIDHFYTARALEAPSPDLTRKLVKIPRRLLFAANQDLAAHLLGGFSLLVLAR